MQPLTVSVPWLEMPPPAKGAELWLFETALFASVRVPLLAMPPSLPLATVNPDRLAVWPASTVRIAEENEARAASASSVGRKVGRLRGDSCRLRLRSQEENPMMLVLSRNGLRGKRHRSRRADRAPGRGEPEGVGRPEFGIVRRCRHRRCRASLEGVATPVGVLAGDVVRAVAAEDAVADRHFA